MSKVDINSNQRAKNQCDGRKLQKMGLTSMRFIWLKNEQAIDTKVSKEFNHKNWPWNVERMLKQKLKKLKAKLIQHIKCILQCNCNRNTTQIDVHSNSFFFILSNFKVLPTQTNMPKFEKKNAQFFQFYCDSNVYWKFRLRCNLHPQAISFSKEHKQ